MDIPSPTTLSEYEYFPLKSETSIRLLKLLPGKSDTIECEIFEASTEDRVPFIALSYVWGSENDSKTILCSGKHYLNVRSNLFHALWHIRHLVNPRTLWVDAICINQTNVSERNHQVSRMTQIYTQAEHLLIWLGSQNSDVAVKLIAYLATFSERQKMPGGMIVKPRIHLEEWKLLKFYLGASWFQRMWVVQELVLGLKLDGPSATEILLGPHSLLWAELIRCCEWIRGNYSTLLANSETITNSDAILRGVDRVLFLHRMAIQPTTNRQNERDWMRWLMSTLPVVRPRKSSDPRDKLFALYGLCSSLPKPLPDYTLSTSEVYRRFTVDTIRITRSLDVLHEIEVKSTPSGISLPSWVPNWIVPLERISFKDRDDLKPTSWNPDNAPTSKFETPPDTKVLPLTGMIVDEIVYTSDAITLKEITELDKGKGAWLFKLWNNEKLYQRLEPKELKAVQPRHSSVVHGNSRQPARERRMYPTREPFFSCFVRTMITNEEFEGLSELISDGDENFWENLGNTARTEYAQKQKLIYKRHLNKQSWNRRQLIIQPVKVLRTILYPSLVSFSGLTVASPPLAIKSSTMETYLSLLVKWAQGRLFFTTKSGYIGLGVKNTKVGDSIAIISSYGNVSRTPFTLRRLRAKFQLVGEAYIHGLKYDSETGISWVKVELV